MIWASLLDQNLVCESPQRSVAITDLSAIFTFPLMVFLPSLLGLKEVHGGLSIKSPVRRVPEPWRTVHLMGCFPSGGSRAGRSPFGLSFSLRLLCRAALHDSLIILSLSIFRFRRRLHRASFGAAGYGSVRAIGKRTPSCPRTPPFLLSRL